MTLPFFKYHGLGNDFILLESAPPLDPAHAQALCDRHHGIGADGVLLVAPHPTADTQMIVFNADGSRPEMCGNGLRCVAFHVASRQHHHPTTTTVHVATDAGDKRCLVALDPPNPEASVRVDLGPVAPPQHQTVRCQGHDLTLLTTSVGNPHAVLLNPPAPFETLAPLLSSHTAFPDGVNVSFVLPVDDALHVRVWERGVGPTLACGTAACAVAAVAVHHGLAQRDHPVHVHLPGGPLQIVLTEDNHAIMTGPARQVFQGTLRVMPPPGPPAPR